MCESSTAVLVEHLFRHEAGRIVSKLASAIGFTHIEVAEDAVQESLIAALRTWPIKGLPHNPSGWLYAVAKNRAIDILRRNGKQADMPDVFDSLEMTAAPAKGEYVMHHRLRLLFICAHPDIGPEYAVSLSLKLVCGFGTREIARAFGLNDDTVRKRIYRAKEQLKRLTDTELTEITDIEKRRRRVIATLYLLFNEGYSSHSVPGSLHREFLHEAIDLVEELCDDPYLGSADGQALAALMYFHGARIPARIAPDNQSQPCEEEFVPYHEQNRSEWNEALIKRGMVHFKMSMKTERNSRFHIEAAIAASYCDTQSEPDWIRILSLYDQLIEIAPSPFARMNRALVYGKIHGPESGIKLLLEPVISAPLSDYMLYHASLSHLYSLIDGREQAVEHLEKAKSLAETEGEIAVLTKRLDALKSPTFVSSSSPLNGVPAKLRNSISE